LVAYVGLVSAIALVFAGAAILAFAVLLRLRATRERDSAWAWVATRVPCRDEPFGEKHLAQLPAVAQRFYRFAIAPSAPIRTVAEIRHAGFLGSGGRRVKAFQILACPYGAVWRYSGQDAFPFSGFASFWKAGILSSFWHLGFLPARSSTSSTSSDPFGRMLVDALLWTPAALLPRRGIEWTEVDEVTARVTVDWERHTRTVELALEPDGQPGEILLLSEEGQENGLCAKPSEFDTVEGYRLPMRAEFRDSARTASFLSRSKLRGIRFPGPWIGSSHS
jgi:hypothetical protein